MGFAEAIAALKAIEGAEAHVTELETEWNTVQQSVTDLTSARDAADAARTLAEAAAQEHETALSTFRADAVKQYRAAVVGDDDLLGTLVTGDTFEAIQQSLTTAKDVIAKAQARVASQPKPPAGTVPPGSSTRVGLDMASMTPREKILAGVELGKK